MKDTLKKPYLAVLGAAFLISLAATVLRTFLLLSDYDAVLGHFAATPLSEILFPLLFVIAAVFYIVFGIIAKGDLDKKTLEAPLPIIFSSAFATVATAVWLIAHIGHFVFLEGLSRIFGILTLLFALGLVAYFLSAALSIQNETVKILSGVCAVLFCVFYILYSYFDAAFALNSPIKVFDQLTFLVFVLFFLAECRFSFHAISYAVYLPLALLCATFSMANAFPALIYAALERAPLSGNIMHDFLVFAMFCYAVTRLVCVLITEKIPEESGSYEEEIAAESAAEHTPDRDTHITLSDPDQESFDFDTPIDENEATEKKTDE